MNYIEHIKLPDCLVIKTNCGQIRIKPYKNIRMLNTIIEVYILCTGNM